MKTFLRLKYNYFPIKKKFKIEKRKILSQVKELISLAILLFARSTYIKSLKGCFADEFKCIVNLQIISDVIYYCLKSILLFFIFIGLLQFKFCSKYLLIIFFFIILELFLRDHGESLSHHGFMNFLALCILLFLGEIIIIIIILINNIKNKKCLIIIFINFASLYIFLYNKYKDKYFCKNWDRGLNGTFISNNKSLYSCSVDIPTSKCFIDIISPILDFSKLLNIKCEQRKEKEKYLLKQSSNLNTLKEIKKIGYPITINSTEEIKGNSALYSESLMKFVLNNMINLDDKNILNKLNRNMRPEVYIDYTNNPYGELKQDINFNEKLSQERWDLSKKNKISNDILILFMDNLSRVHFYRQYKKTSKFIKKFLSFKGFSTENNSDQKYHGFEFLKYHKIKGATLFNAIPMFSGVYYDKKNRMISIVKEMKKLGYITCNVQDICHKELMGIGKIDNYSYIEFDHEYSAPNCDPNIYTLGYGLSSGENGIFRKCLYGKESIEHALKYGKNFWKAYGKNKKFLRIVNTYAHEYSGEKSKYADTALYNFLVDLYSSEQLKETTIILVGDHGNVLFSTYKLIEPNDVKIEQFFPILIIISPDKKNISFQNQYSEITKNQQIFVTPFDIYYTLRDLLYGKEYKNNLLKEQSKDEGESLFKYINQLERNCSKYKQMTECYCN